MCTWRCQGLAREGVPTFRVPDCPPRRLNHRWHRGTWAPACRTSAPPNSLSAINHHRRHHQHTFCHQIPSTRNSPSKFTSSNRCQEAMVCSKCLKLSKGTTLATPGVKKKSEMYHGSPASSSSKSATLGQTGIGKVRKAPSVHVCRLRAFGNSSMSTRASCFPRMQRTLMLSTQGELLHSSDPVRITPDS